MLPGPTLTAAALLDEGPMCHLFVRCVVLVGLVVAPVHACSCSRVQGEEYVNSKTLTDVTFNVEGRPFYAHRIALLASSEAFRAMFGQVSGLCRCGAGVRESHPACHADGCVDACTCI